MNAVKLLNECEARNITLKLVDGELRYRAPREALTEDFLETLRANKPNLMEILKSDNYYDRHVRVAISEFNDLGIRYTDIAEVNRRKADEFDREMTEAANRNDREAFLLALEKWRGCFN
jgi:hypothetical protein